MRQTKHVLFAFSPYTYKAVEAYLNRQAARGWALERIGPFEQLARFRRTDRTDLRCCTDLLPTGGGRRAGPRWRNTWPCAGRQAGSLWTGRGP